MDNEFWGRLHLPTQDQHNDVEYVNPAEAYRKQVDAINLSSPLFAELEVVDALLKKTKRIENELTRRLLSQGMDGMKGVQTRTNDLVDAYVLAAAQTFRTDSNTIKDVSMLLLKLRRRASALETRKDKLERRIKSIQQMADYCDRIMNWAKFSAKLERVI